MDEKVIVLQAGVWLWDAYGKSIIDKALVHLGANGE